MISYISTRKHVRNVVRPYCNKEQSIYVTNRIITRLRDRRVLDRDVADLIVTVTPLPQNPDHSHESIVELDSGFRVYFAVIYKRN